MKQKERRDKKELRIIKEAYNPNMENRRYLVAKNEEIVKMIHKEKKR